jgi:hypothetical protein
MKLPAFGCQIDGTEVVSSKVCPDAEDSTCRT